jgi:hypothetical protein
MKQPDYQLNLTDEELDGIILCLRAYQYGYEYAEQPIPDWMISCQKKIKNLKTTSQQDTNGK